MAVPQQNDVPNPSSQNRGRRRSGSVSSNAYQTQRRHQTRNVRTSSMPGTPLNQEARTRATIDEKFLADYQSKGIQPHSITDKPTPQKPQTPSVTRNETVEYTNIPRETQSVQQRTDVQKSSLANKSFYRVRATSINIGILAAGISSWLAFQIPFALLNISSLGLAGAIDFVNQAVQVGESSNFLLRLAGSVWNSAVQFVADIGTFFPNTIFQITFIIIFAYGIFQLLIMYFLYTMARLNPIFGEGGGLKFGMFLLAFIGYSLPILNLFPWFLVWAVAVWLYPK